MLHLTDKLLHSSSSPHCKKCQADVYDGTSLIACGPGSVAGIATGYGMDGLGIESRWGARFSAPVQTGPGVHPASCAMGMGYFPGAKSDRGVKLTPHSFQCCWSWKSRAIPVLPLREVRPVQSLSTCTKGALYLFTFDCLQTVEQIQYAKTLPSVLHTERRAVVKIQVFWYVRPYRLVNSCRHLRANVPSKRRQIFISLHGTTSVKSWTSRITAMTASNIVILLSLKLEYHRAFQSVVHSQRIGFGTLILRNKNVSKRIFSYLHLSV
jgi:hypothetical protein